MWLLPSQLRSSHSQPEWQASSSGCGSPDCTHVFWPALSGTPMPRPCSWRGWRTRPWSLRLFGAATWSSSMPDHLQEWVSSALGTPAPASPAPGSASGSGTPGGSGPRSPGSSLSAGLHTSSSRTSAAIFDSPSTMFGETWDRWATGVRQDFSRRRRLGRRTSGNGSSSWQSPNSVDSTQRMYQAGSHAPTQSLACPARLWPTPAGADSDRASLTYAHGENNLTLKGAAALWPTPSASVVNDGEPVKKHAERLRMLKDRHGNGNGAGTPLTIAARTWPTPSTQDAKNNGGPSQAVSASPPLSSVASQWPTPRSSDRENRTTKNAPSHGLTHGKTLAGEASARSLPAPGSEASGHTCSPECLRLNPLFVDWLQGFPPGWTDCDATAMPWFPWWLRTHSERLRAVWELQRDLGW